MVRLAVVLVVLSGCSLDATALAPPTDAAPPRDAASGDAVVPDGSLADARVPDGSATDSGRMDAMPDTSTSDTSPSDAGPTDTGSPDTGPLDTGSPDTRPMCPTGYGPNSVGTCYRYVSATRDWQTAERDCESAGAHLVVVSGASEDGLVPDYNWIGYTEIITAGSFRWVTGTGASSYTGWATGEPVAGGASCAVQRPDGWHDDNCSEAKSYLCEFDGVTADGTTWR